MNNTNIQFGQQNNKSIELSTPTLLDQKLNYLHNNPVEAGFVEEAIHWKYSSAKNYAGEIGQIPIELL